MFSKHLRASEGFPVAQRLKCLPAMWETQVRSLGWEEPLEKETATHSSILAWRIPCTEEPGRLWSIVKVKVKSLSRVQLFVTPWTVAHQAPPPMGFSKQEYWSGLPFPSPGDLHDPGIKPRSPTLQADALTSEPPGTGSQFL